LLSVVIALIVVALLGLVLRLAGEEQILGDVADVALVLTLAALLVYVYCTYALAKDAWTPSASFALAPYPDDCYHFAFLIHNHSKFPLKCWCNLNATVNGRPVSLEGFYGGKSSFDLQPFGGGSGHFDVRDILAKAGADLDEMKREAPSGNAKQQLYLNIEFWYAPGDPRAITRNPRQPHYFDFECSQMVADF
jgi:hypothetical protein